MLSGCSSSWMLLQENNQPLPPALAMSRGLGLALCSSQGMLWLGDSSRTSSLPGGQRASRTVALTVLCPQPCDVESEGGGEDEFTSMQPFRAVCCMALALLPANARAAPCPGVPSSASSALKPDLLQQSPVGSVSAWGPPVLLQMLLHPWERQICLREIVQMPRTVSAMIS